LAELLTNLENWNDAVNTLLLNADILSASKSEKLLPQDKRLILTRLQTKINKDMTFIRKQLAAS